MNRRINRWVGTVAVLIVVAELVVVLLSWLLSAMMTDGVRSLLSGEGIRWYFSHFVDFLASPLLVWLLLLSMTVGSLVKSGIRSPQGYRDRLALRFAFILVAVYVLLVLVLTLLPHGVLLSATGRLFPSPFSRALVPIVAFGILLLSVTYGLVSGRFRSAADVVASLCYGIAASAPLFLLYVLILQFYHSLRYVFPIGR